MQGTITISRGYTALHLTLSHHIQKLLDAEIESYIVHLDISATFDTVSLSGPVFKLKSIG